MPEYTSLEIVIFLSFESKGKGGLRRCDEPLVINYRSANVHCNLKIKVNTAGKSYLEERVVQLRRSQGWRPITATLHSMDSPCKIDFVNPRPSPGIPDQIYISRGRQGFCINLLNLLSAGSHSPKNHKYYKIPHKFGEKKSESVCERRELRNNSNILQ